VLSQPLSATEYRLLVEHSPVMIWRAALNTQCDYFNDTWLEFTGRGLAEELGEGWAKGVHPDDLEGCVRYYLDHFAAREAFEMEYRLRRHDGVYRWILDRGAPYFDDDGVFAGFIGSCVDVDDRRRSQDERDRKGEQLLADARDFERWILAIVSHDIRNPLNAVELGASRLMMIAADPAAVRTTAERMLRSARRIEHIVGDLLDLSRDRQGGGLPVSPARTNLETLCRQVLEEFDEAAGGRALDLRSEGHPEGDWDAHRVTQALSNLIGNAIQHSPAGSPVSVKIDGRDDIVFVDVHNQGQIDPELLPVIFDPFRSGREKTARGSGLGLGLFIARAIARAHRGGLEVASTAEAGTTFRIGLPRSRVGAG
jgi:two-component system, OmpR family, sensor histidine kinase VicK